jgi:hypothetical protein
VIYLLVSIDDLFNGVSGREFDSPRLHQLEGASGFDRDVATNREMTVKC